MNSADARGVERDRQARYAAMTPAERVAIAVRLGSEGLAAFMQTQAIDRPTAIRRVKALHRLGRRPSACAIASED